MAEQDEHFTAVIDALTAAHPLFSPVTVQRLVDRIAREYRLLEGTDLHVVTVRDEAERQLSYADPAADVVRRRGGTTRGAPLGPLDD